MRKMYKKRSIAFYLHLYFKIIAQDIKSKMSYRADFLISTIGIIVSNIAGFVTFWIIFTKFPSINGWNYYEMLFLYGFSLIAITPTQCLLDNNWQLRSYVYSGDFVKYCFRPVNLFFYYQSEIFDVKGLGQLIFGFGMLAYSWTELDISVTLLAVLKAIVFLITASLFMMAFQNLAAAICFWIQNSFYILDFSYKMKDYAKYPITIFEKSFKFLFTFVFPVAFIAYYPSLVLLRPQEIPILSWISPFLGIIFFYLSYKIWMIGASRYDGSGT